MRNKKRNLIVIALGATTLIGTALGYREYNSRKDSEFSARGELMDDYIYDTPIGRFYRVEIKTPDGKEVGYPVLADEKELEKLDSKYKSCKESGRVGDYIGINPNSMIFSLDERVLLPENIKLLEKGN